MLEGRYLIGLEPIERTLAFLARQTDEKISKEALQERIDAARRYRASRPTGPEQPPVQPLPPEFAEHAQRVRERDLYRKLFADRDVEIGLVDIASLITVQPHVDFTFAQRRAAAAPTLGDALAVCLPAEPERADVWGGLTAAPKTACTICAHDLNLNVTEAKMEASDGLKVTFTFGKTSVFVQALEHNGRYYLKDGTHRAVGFLAAGLTHLPCIINKGGRERNLPDTLPVETLLSDEPPRIADFLAPELYLAYPWQPRVKFIRITVDDFVAPSPDD
ncbi:MAG TPA: hypothetical protein VFK80_06300 [Limnochordia bacterium]|nr:hypothetical protein [Limnochordia bacterium]